MLGFVKFWLKIDAVLILLIIFLPVTIIYARQGCCSHHGGVCGCGCCDGTGLSSTCAPYYPECNRPIYIEPTLIPTLRPTSILKPTSTPRSTSTPTVVPILEVTQSVESQSTQNSSTITPEVEGVSTSNSGVSNLITLITIGGLGYLLSKWFKKRKSSNEVK
jgi:hypothetical protein